MNKQEKIQAIVDYINNGGGASVFHELDELFLSTHEIKNGKYVLGNKIRDYDGVALDLDEKDLDLILAEINHPDEQARRI